MDAPGVGSKRPTADDLRIVAEVRALRKAANVSQATLAEAIGITTQQVSKYETGRNRMSAGHVDRAKAFLGGLGDCAARAARRPRPGGFSEPAAAFTGPPDLDARPSVAQDWERLEEILARLKRRMLRP